MYTNRSARARPARFLFAVAVGLSAAGLPACERNHAAGPTTAASPMMAETASAKAPVPDGGSGKPEAATYRHLEGLYRELAGTGTAPKQPWLSLAQQMAYMHQLANQGSTPAGPGMMGGQRDGGGPGMMEPGGGMMGRPRSGGSGMGPEMMGPQGGMMGGGPGMMWQRACGLDDWNRRMAAMSRRDAEAARAAGDAHRAGTLDEVAREHDKLADQIATAPSPTVGSHGGEIFAATCAPCHRPQGEGVPGVFPPLQGDPVVNGPDGPLIQVVLGGLDQPLEIRGQRYFGVMPSFAGRLDDATLAAVLTYVRSAWGNSAPPVTPQRVAAVRR